jgi:hypothetical protein
VIWQPISNLPGAAGVRPALECTNCTRPVRTLFFNAMTLVCRNCTGALYASQLAKRRSDLDHALAILVELGGVPLLHAPFPPKPEWCDDARYARFHDQFEVLKHRVMMRAIADGRRGLERAYAAQPKPLRQR